MNTKMSYFSLRLILLLVVPCLSIAQKTPRRLWFDTDLMIGLPERAPREVDDAVTLIMALKHSDKVDLVGISTVTYADYGYQTAQKLLKWYAPDRNIPVYRGSDKCGDVGIENDATRALAAVLKKEKLTIAAIGPATNIATVIKNHPELVAQIEEITFCAGRTPDFPFRPGLQKITVWDYNFDKDVEAFKVIFESGVRVVLSGFECSSSLLLGRVDLAFLDNSFEGDKWLHDQFRAWSLKNKAFFGVDGFIPYDTTPLGHITHPQFFKYHRNIPVQINRKKNDATTLMAKPADKDYLEVSFDYPSKWRCDFAYQTLPGFEEIVIESLQRK